MPRALVLVLVLSLLLPLAAGLPGCGDKGDGGKVTSGQEGGGSGAGAPPAADQPSKAPEPAPAKGAKTPQELLDRMEAMANSGSFDLPDLVALVHPDEQPAVAFAMGAMPLVMAPLMIAFAPEEEKAKMEAKLKEVEALLEKYGLSEDAEGLVKSQPEAEPTDEEKVKLFGKLMEGKDHMAFLRESWALLGSLGASTTTTKFEAEAFAKARASLKVDGDRATMNPPKEGKKPLVMVKADDGFWYLSGAQSGLLGK